MQDPPGLIAKKKSLIFSHSEHLLCLSDIYKNAGRPAEGCLYSAHIVQLEILGQQQAQVCFGLGHKAAGLVEDGLLHFVAGQPPVACVPRAGELHGVEIGQQICVAALVQRIPLAARLQLCNGQQLFAGIIGEFNDVLRPIAALPAATTVMLKRLLPVSVLILQMCSFTQ